MFHISILGYPRWLYIPVVYLLWGPNMLCVIRFQNVPETIKQYWMYAGHLGWNFALATATKMKYHDDVIKWKHFPRYWPFVRGIHRSPVNSRHKGQWRGALIFSLICVWINGCANNREIGDLRRHRTHYDVIVMPWACGIPCSIPHSNINLICHTSPDSNVHGTQVWPMNFAIWVTMHRRTVALALIPLTHEQKGHICLYIYNQKMKIIFNISCMIKNLRHV